MKHKDIIKILSLLSEEEESTEAIEKHVINNSMIGKCVMIRTYSAGVHFGTLITKDGQSVLLHNAKRVHYWDGACSLSQLAKDGSSKGEDCRISVKVKEIILEQVIETILMTDEAIENLYGIKEWKK